MGDFDEFVERCCEVMHDAYEKAAVGAGWETQQASRKPWNEVPEANQATMRAAVRALLTFLDREDPEQKLLDMLQESIEADYAAAIYPGDTLANIRTAGYDIVKVKR